MQVSILDVLRDDLVPHSHVTRDDFLVDRKHYPMLEWCETKVIELVIVEDERGALKSVQVCHMPRTKTIVIIEPVPGVDWLERLLKALIRIHANPEQFGLRR